MNVRVFFNPLDAKSKEEFAVDVGTGIIDFLQREFPQGFNAPVRIFAGTTELDPDEWDKTIEQDERITILVMPAGAGILTTVGTWLLQAAVAAAIGYVINLIFRPKTPGGLNEGDESPVYSIGATKNQQRIGSPVEVVYGSVLYPPSFASAPYSFNSTDSNEQFVDELLCLGEGKFIIDDILIGNQSISTMELSTVKYWVFDSSQHQQTMGNIEATVNADVLGTETPIPFYENMYTSPEVGEYIFRHGTTTKITTPAAFAGTAFAATATDPGKITGVDISVATGIQVGINDIVTLSNTVSNNVTFTIGTIVPDVGDPDTATLFETANSNVLQDESPLPVGTLYTLNETTSNSSAGPYRAQRDGDVITEVWIDILFPQGLFSVDGTDGDIQSSAMSMQASYQKIDSNGLPDGAPVVKNYSTSNTFRQPVRWSFSSGALTPGAYEVTLIRTGEYGDQRQTDTTQWSGMRGAIQLDTTSGAVYGDTTLLAIRLKASNGLAQAARERVRVKATRVLPDDTKESQNPISVIKDIWTNNEYGLGRPLAGLDTATLDPLELEWDGGYPLPEFNATFENRGTGFDAMETVASVLGGKIIQDNGLVSLAFDQVQDIRTALFSSANIVKDSLSILYTFNTQDEYDSVKVEYRDPDTFDPAYISHPTEGVDPDSFTLFGSTDRDYSYQMAQYLWNVKARRRKRVTFQTELEGLLPKFNDRIGVSHPVADWGQSGVFVQQISATQWYVDQALDWTTNNILMIRTELGTPSEIYAVSAGATDNIVVFAAEPLETIATAELRDPTNYIFGTSESFVQDFQVTKVSPASDIILEIEAQTYSEIIYDGAPPHMGGTQLVLKAEMVFPPRSTANMQAEQIVTGFVEVSGDNVIFNWRGYVSYQVSNDGGATFQEALVTAETDPKYKLTALQQDGGKIWANVLRLDSTRDGRLYSSDDGVLWSQEALVNRTDNCRDMLVEGSTVVYGGSEGGDQPTWGSLSQGSSVITEVNIVGPAIWRVLPISNKFTVYGWANFASSEAVPIDARKISYVNNNWNPDTYVELGFQLYDARYAVCIPYQGLVLDIDPDTANLTGHVNMSAVLAGDLSLTAKKVVADFGIPIRQPSICVAGSNYVISALDYYDSSVLHLRYADSQIINKITNATSFEVIEWNVYDSIRLNGSQTLDPGADSRSQSRYREIYYDTVSAYFYYAYVADFDTDSFKSVLERFKLGVSLPEVTPLTLVLCHFDDYAANIFTSQIGSDVFSENLGKSAVSKYGSGALDYDGINRAYIETDLPELDTNNYTIEFYYRASTLGSYSGLFNFGGAGSTNMINCWVTTEGAVQLSSYIGTYSQYNFKTADAVITVGQWHEICCEIDRDNKNASIYVDGVKLGAYNIELRMWVSDTSNAFLIGRADMRPPASAVVESQGEIDELRISNGARYQSVNYTPHAAPFGS